MAGLSSSSAPPRVRPQQWALSVGVAAVLVGLDQVTKQVAESSLMYRDPVPVVGDLVRFMLVYNPGAAFSFGTAFTPVFTVLSTAAVVGLVWALGRDWAPWVRRAMMLLLGGAAGNLMDRLFREPGFAVGHVVDFIALPNFPVFNVADMFITAGGALVVAMSLFPQRFGLALDQSQSENQAVSEGEA